MRRRTTLLLSVEGHLGLRAEINSLVAMGRGGEFPTAEEILPAAAAGAELGTLLGEALTRLSPAVVVLGIPHSAHQHTGPMLRMIRTHSWHLPVLAVLESGRPEEAIALLELGATDFAVPPLRECDFLPRLRRLQALADAGDVPGNELAPRPVGNLIVGESAQFTAVLQLLPKLARRDASVLITGETGTGKELFAHALHELSPRAHQPFIPVNCGAIPADLMENELFGHERGAFTGATTAVRGMIAAADRGTLFLDEIDSLPPPMQVKLLRFLQDHAYRPLGGHRARQAEVRVVAAANTNLEAAVRAGQFRSDLFYRINVLTLHLPPLRERRDDIPLLARHFLAKHGRRSSGPALDLSPAALQRLGCHPWPGNVRELENVIHRAVVLCEHATLGSEDIFLPAAPDATEPATFKALKARAVVDFERYYLHRVLAEHAGNITRAAQAAGKDRRAFWQLLRKHGLHHPPPAPDGEPRRDTPGLRPDNSAPR